MPEQVCLFCGGDPTAPDHAASCDGRQGHIDAPDDVPLLIAGLTEATWGTSAAAAISVEESKDSQRAAVKAAIVAAGQSGRTDDEVQVLLGLDGSSERPRRWELWKLNQIRILHDDEGKPVRRLTRTQRRAVVWVAA
jgi:hypothetical protein